MILKEVFRTYPSFTLVIPSMKKSTGTTVMAGLPRVVGLNVGGYPFTTTHYTITQFSESKLAKMLNSENQIAKDPKGNYFIDRDGAMFKYVLNFLRTQTLAVPEDFQDYEQLETEARFFEIKPLEEAVQKALAAARNRKMNKPGDEILRLFYSSKTKLVLAGGGKTLQQLVPDARRLGGSLLSGPSYNFNAGEDIVEGGQLKVPIRLEQLDAFLQHVANQGFEVKMSNFFMDGNASQVWVFTRKFQE